MGSGTLLTTSGSLLFVNSYCDSWTVEEGTTQILDSSGSLINVQTTTPICDHWAYSIEIPFIAFTVKASAGTLFSFGIYMLLLYIVLKVLLKIASSFFGIFTTRRL